MPPHSAETEKDLLPSPIVDGAEASKAVPKKLKLHYIPIITLSYYHLAGIYGLYLCFTSAKWATLGFEFLIYILAEFGVTAGAHRLWSHRSYKAKLPLEIFLLFLNCLSYQNDVIHWARDHRSHHKFGDTDADPSNAKRGFFFSHIGWILTRKSNEVVEAGKKIDVSDLNSNPLLRFQKKYTIPLFGTFCFLLPALVPVYFWGESFKTAWHVNLLRYVINFHVSCMSNSFSHKVGYKTYDKSKSATNNLICNIFCVGEGFHNFHHVFPWDYKSSELGNTSHNLTTMFINFFAWMGLAYDLKEVPQDLVNIRKLRTGDGTDSWGWGDKNIGEDAKKSTRIHYPEVGNSENIML